LDAQHLHQRTIALLGAVHVAQMAELLQHLLEGNPAGVAAASAEPAARET